MIHKAIDNLSKDWDEQLYPQFVRKSAGRNVRGGDQISKVKPILQSSHSSFRQKIYRTTLKTAEVMVKISGGGKNMVSIKAHMDYISRHGQLELEDENGDLHRGKESLIEIRDAWAYGRIGIPFTGEKRKEAFNIILSMPPGTDRFAVKQAARYFAQEQFKDHQYIFTAHDDEKHPHVHLCVKATDRHGIRLNPRKGDLQFWREQFAEKLRDQGIAANATLRRARGITQKAEKQVVRHINKEFYQNKRQATSHVLQAQKQAALCEVRGDERIANPAQHKIMTTREQVQTAYQQIAKLLIRGNRDDQKLAHQITHFVQTMPAPLTKHETLVKTLTNKIDKPIIYEQLEKILSKTESKVREHDRY